MPGAYTDASGFDVIDEWGRMVPDPDRWPSSKGGKGFSEVAKKVHDMGLKFGIHVMRGISAQAVNANTPILDTSKVLSSCKTETYLCLLSCCIWGYSKCTHFSLPIPWRGHGYDLPATVLSPPGTCLVRDTGLRTLTLSYCIDSVVQK